MLYFIQNFFLLNIFSVPGCHPAYHIMFSHQIYLGFSWPWQCSDLTCFDDIDNFEKTVFCRMSINCDLSDISLLLDWGYGFRKEDHRDKASFSLHHIKQTYYQPVTTDIDLDHLAELMFVVHLHSGVTFFLPFLCYTSWKKVTMLKEWGIKLHLLEDGVSI